MSTKLEKAKAEASKWAQAAYTDAADHLLVEQARVARVEAERELARLRADLESSARALALASKGTS